jgi:hypothetical protein
MLRGVEKGISEGERGVVTAASPDEEERAVASAYGGMVAHSA